MENSTGLKSFYIKTYGCQMNSYDTQRVEELLVTNGWTKVDNVAEADFIILNTCHIRAKAVEKIYSEVGRFKKLTVVDRNGLKYDRSPLIGVIGCVAQAEGREIMKRAPSVHMVVGPQSYHLLPDLLKEVAGSRHRVVATEFPVADKFDRLPMPSGLRVIDRGPTAFLTIQEGCDKFCSFCVVPYTRGVEASRSVCSILEEARSLIAHNVREITLLGQNVNAYRGQGPDGKDWNLAMLLAELSDIEGLKRLRYTTSHPVDMDDELIEAHRNIPKLMPFLHLPVQSGSDRILSAMNRKYSRADYIKLVEKIRTARPDIALSGDFIVGFPGETEEDFLQTLSIAKEVGYSSAFSFFYSRRPGTVAASLVEQVPESVKRARLLSLIHI